MQKLLDDDLLPAALDGSVFKWIKTNPNSDESTSWCCRRNTEEVTHRGYAYKVDIIMMDRPLSFKLNMKVIDIMSPLWEGSDELGILIESHKTGKVEPFKLGWHDDAGCFLYSVNNPKIEAVIWEH